MEPPYVPTSAETVTEAWLKKVLSREFGSDGSSSLVITRMEVTPGAMRTDGFLSRLQRIYVKARPERTDDQAGDGGAGEEKEFHLVAKLHPPGEVHRKIVRNMRAFEREIHVYDTFQKMVMEQQGGALCNHKKIQLSIPKCYFHEIGMDAACIVMEDLRNSGFRLNNKQLGMTYKHAELCIRAEATFNALGYNAKKRLGLEEFLVSNAPLLLEPFSPQLGLMVDYQIFPGVISFARGQNREDLAQRLETYCKRVSPFGRLLAGVKRRGEMATFGHGDCWNNNYMFRYKKDAQGNEVPVEVKILDLQISRYCNPTADLAAFFMCNIDDKIREKHLDELLELYYETLALTLERLGTPEWSRDIYSFDNFKTDMTDAWEYGFLLACWLVPVILSEDEDVPNFDTLEEEKVFEFFEDHQQRMTGGINQNVIQRITQILDFGVRQGLI